MILWQTHWSFCTKFTHYCKDFPVTPLILGLSHEPDFILHQISYPSSIFLLLLAWLVDKYRLFLLLISLQFEKKPKALKECTQCDPLYSCVWVHKCVHGCVCPQGSSCSVPRVKSVCLLWSTACSFYLTSDLRCDCPVKDLIENNLKRTNTARVAYRMTKLCDQLKKKKCLLSH